MGISNPGIDWVIVGGESGPGARPMHPMWAQGLRDQCQAAEVPFFFKQWGEWDPVYHLELLGRGCTWRDMGDGVQMWRWGKQVAGRVLDGRTWEERPEVTR